MGILAATSLENERVEIMRFEVQIYILIVLHPA
jgi:hypothetical protein